jgi:hypothetical protein
MKLASAGAMFEKSCKVSLWLQWLRYACAITSYVLHQERVAVMKASWSEAIFSASNNV